MNLIKVRFISCLKQMINYTNKTFIQFLMLRRLTKIKHYQYTTKQVLPNKPADVVEPK